MHGNKRLSHNQVQAVQHLVASAVPGLLPTRISVVDDRGTLLAGGFEADNAVANTNERAEQRRIQFENRTAKAVEELLEKTVGQGKVRAEVHADMNFDRINTQEEIFDPESQVVRSVQSVEEAVSNSDGPLPVTVATNLPEAGFEPADTNSRSATEQRSEETINYEISKKIINHVREAGIVNRCPSRFWSTARMVPATTGPKPTDRAPRKSLTCSRPWSEARPASAPSAATRSRSSICRSRRWLASHPTSRR
jgi:flagellar M-ring protein FliF